MKTEKFDIKGMTCSACVAHVEKSVTKLEGIDFVQVNLLSNSMTVSYDPAKVSSEHIESSVSGAGYEAKIHQNSRNMGSVGSAASELAEMKKRWWISFAFLLPLFYISMGGMIGLPALIHHDETALFVFSQILLTIPIVWFNKRYFTAGFKTLVKASPTMDSLIAIGSTAAIVYSLVIVVQVFTNKSANIHDLYFESAATILTLVTLGKFLEARSKMRTTTALTKLIELAPKTAFVLRGETEMEVLIEDVVENDLVIVKSGQQIPVDGIITTGSAEIDESAITGESLPVFKTENDEVLSGSISKSGYFRFRATKVGENTTLAQIIHLVENAASSKAPVSQLADKISAVFVPIVIAIAIITTLTWLLLGYTIGFAISAGIAVLVISCPCALGLATPVAIMVGAGKGAELGLLIKNALALETAHKIDTVVLDKTGTITEGNPRVTDIYLNNAIDETDFYNVTCALEKCSEHVIAGAIVSDLSSLKTKDLTVSGFENFSGKGIKGIVNQMVCMAGNELFLRENAIDTSEIQETILQLAKTGKTPVIVAVDNQIWGIAGISDKIKTDSQRAIQLLHNMHVEVIMLTGDNQNTAQHIGQKTGIDRIIAGVLPNEKEKQITDLQNKGRIVAMVGDGINDAPSLSSANLGVAIGAGTEIAIDSADVVLMRSKLLDVVTLLQLSKSVIKTIRQNLFWAFIYNIIGIPLAAGVFYLSYGIKLNPMFAAAAMSLSSVTVVLNALRLLRFKQLNPENKVAENETINEIQINKISISSNMKGVNGFKLAFNLKSKSDTTKIMKIEGMTCGHCSGRVEKALNALEGVSAKVDLAAKTATISHSKNVTDEILRNAVENAGYEVVEITA